jgi:hypothetical protein
MPDLSVLATYTVTGDQIVFKDSSEDTCGPAAQEGAYTWAYDGKALTFKVLHDRCVGRQVTAQAGPWVKRP